MREEISLLLTKKMNANQWLRAVQKLLKMAKRGELSLEESKVLDRLMEESPERMNEFLRQLNELMEKQNAKT